MQIKFVPAATVLLLGTLWSAAQDLVVQPRFSVDLLVRSNLVFKPLGDDSLKLDVYIPQKPDSSGPLPVIIFVLGDADANTLKNAKDWKFLQDYGRLAVEEGFAAVVFNHRSSENYRKLDVVRSDIEDAVRWVRAESLKFGIDRDRIGLWLFSGAGTHLPVGFGKDAPHVRCIAAYYPVLAPPDDHAQFEQYSAAAQLQKAQHKPPILVAKAARDVSRWNKLIDEFVATGKRTGAKIELLEHSSGQHAFDIRNNDERSREIIRDTFKFMRSHLKDAPADGE